jgi:hypothetical protein
LIKGFVTFDGHTLPDELARAIFGGMSAKDVMRITDRLGEQIKPKDDERELHQNLEHMRKHAFAQIRVITEERHRLVHDGAVLVQYPTEDGQFETLFRADNFAEAKKAADINLIHYSSDDLNT